ncbi:MAG: 50S ribosomal protein L6 [Acidaminococcus sp.]|uniref:50S ribosomal protein L6 n=1 Tax=Acidaminococcus TaxID=904 RepID=UPI0008DB325B|nr:MULTISPECIES: 50S ribosomal protein L6 [Acidaminococcus]MDO5597476.1 50S ribosomal protein L6 [Acidaminococcus sp.]
MSRIGKAPITVPDKVTVTVQDNLVTVKGPKGELSRQINKELTVELKDGVITVSRPNDDKLYRSLHGLSRTLINNMILGVTEGFSKHLEIQGVGYRVAKKGKALSFTLGFSHPCVMDPPEGISFDCPNSTEIIVSGIDKEKVGAVAAEIRSLRAPEPYKGKGIRYVGEHIIRKEGKAGAKGKK